MTIERREFVRRIFAMGAGFVAGELVRRLPLIERATDPHLWTLVAAGPQRWGVTRATYPDWEHAVRNGHPIPEHLFMTPMLPQSVVFVGKDTERRFAEQLRREGFHWPAA